MRISFVDTSSDTGSDSDAVSPRTTVRKEADGEVAAHLQAMD